jgi:hypothetical protein
MSEMTRTLAERVLPVLQAASAHVTGFAYGADDLDPYDKAGWAVTYDGSEGEADLDAVAEAIAAFVCEVTAPITADDVIAERARRLAAGFDYDFGDARGVHRIGTTEADMTGWDEVAKGAQAAISLGQPDFAINLVTDTGPVTVTALEFQEIIAAASAHRQPTWAASFALQALEPIPADYADDSYWSATA